MSLIQNINYLARNLSTLEKAKELLTPKAIKAMEAALGLPLEALVKDLKKGVTADGKRKLDIDIHANSKGGPSSVLYNAVTIAGTVDKMALKVTFSKPVFRLEDILDALLSAIVTYNAHAAENGLSLIENTSIELVQETGECGSPWILRLTDTDRLGGETVLSWVQLHSGSKYAIDDSPIFNWFETTSSVMLQYVQAERENQINGFELQWAEYLKISAQEFARSQKINEDRFNALLANSGYTVVGEYAAGVVLTEYNQIVRDESGEFWRVSGQVDLPYVTVGTGMPEDGAFVSVGDAALRRELANPDKGAAMVARGVVAVDSIADLLALPEGQRKEGLQYLVKGYHAGSDKGGGEFYYDAARASENSQGLVVGGFVRVISAPLTPEDFGAVGRAALVGGVVSGADDSGAVEAWLSSRVHLTTPIAAGYRITRGFKVPSLTKLTAGGFGAKFLWDGGNGVGPEERTIVFDVSSSNPDITALANVILENIHLEMNDAENIIGFNLEYASVKSQFNGLNAHAPGANSTGFRLNKMWYASTNGLSCRSITKAPGSVGCEIATTRPIGQVNRVPLTNLQCHGTDVGLLLDTSGSDIYSLDVTGEIENCNTGVKHIGGLGVRQGRLHVYFENNGTAVDWGATPGGADTDRTGSITWDTCAFYQGAVVNISEGDHSFLSCNDIGTLNLSGGRVYVQGSAEMIKNVTGGTLRHDISVTARQNRMSHASEEGSPIIGATSNQVLSSSVNSADFVIPSDLLRPKPAVGMVMRVTIIARRTHTGFDRICEGMLVQTADDSWVLSQLSNSSEEDSEWTVSVDHLTGTLTVTYSVSEQKILYVMWMPL